MGVLYFAWAQEHHLLSHHVLSPINFCSYLLGPAGHHRSSQPFFRLFLYLPWPQRDKVSLSERVVVQQIKTNVTAFCSRSQHILTRRSHYITHWKWPEMHVRLNQLAPQPLVQLRPRVGVVSVVCSVVSAGSQRSSKCWNQLSCTCHLSLSNGKSIVVGWRVPARPNKRPDSK